MKNAYTTSLWRSEIITTLQKSTAIVSLLAIAPVISAAEIHFSDTATGAATWRIDSVWSGGTQPTVEDDVIFDFANTTTITSMALHTSPDDFYANSLTFGSATGPALGAFELRNGNSGSANRNLFLTSGAITVASQVTGTQTMRSAQGKTSLFAVDGSFEINNNSNQLFVINSYFSDHTGPASLTLTSTTGGSITFGGFNTHTGGTTITAGSLVTATTASAFGEGAVAIGSGSVLDLVNTINSTVAGLNDVGGAGGTVTRSTTSNTRNLILNGSDSYAFSGSLTTSGTATASHFTLQITGGGTQRLSGDNTYGGATTITDGTLLANNTTGSATGTGNVSVGADGVLGGTGFVASASSGASTSTFSAGDGGAGTFTVTGNLSLQNGATFNFELGSVSDKIVVGGTLRGSTSEGDLVFNFSDAGGLQADTAYTLFDYSGGSLNSFDVSDFSLSATSISAGFVLDAGFGIGGWFIDTTNNLLQVQFSGIPLAPIPEPATVGMLAGLLALGSTIGFRRRRHAV